MYTYQDSSWIYLSLKNKLSQLGSVLKNEKNVFLSGEVLYNQQALVNKKFPYGIDQLLNFKIRINAFRLIQDHYLMLEFNCYYRNKYTNSDYLIDEIGLHYERNKFKYKVVNKLKKLPLYTESDNNNLQYLGLRYLKRHQWDIIYKNLDLLMLKYI